MNPKVKVATLSVVSNTLLIILKVIVGVLSGSVSIISEAIHSAMDLFASFVAYFSVKFSDIPPDPKHPYGHGKYENISGVAEAILILIAAAWIIVEAVKKLAGEPFELEMIWVATAVMVVSAVVNSIVSHRLYQVARRTKSIALEADALHLKADVYTSLGVGAGLVLIKLTGIKWLDPVVAIIVAFLIIHESFELLKKAFSPLIDSAWSGDEIKVLEKRLHGMKINYHALKTRAAGNYRFIDIHVEIPENVSVGDAHRYCNEIEEELSRSYENLTINIHIEPE